MNETTAVFLGIIIGVFIVLFCCAILYAYTKISKKVDSFKETERKAYAKVRERTEEKYKELNSRVTELERSDREKKLSDERLRHEMESLKSNRIPSKTKFKGNVIPLDNE